MYLAVPVRLLLQCLVWCAGWWQHWQQVPVCCWADCEWEGCSSSTHGWCRCCGNQWGGKGGGGAAAQAWMALGPLCMFFHNWGWPSEVRFIKPCALHMLSEYRPVRLLTQRTPHLLGTGRTGLLHLMLHADCPQKPSCWVV